MTTRTALRASWLGHRHPAVLLAMIVALLIVVGVLTHLSVQNDVSRLEPARRAEIFRRAHGELRETCVLPDAADGPLRDHCIEIAKFILLFPECNGPCAELARGILPQPLR
jgi:hypothetical protein